MLISWTSALLLATCVASVTSEYNPEICNVVNENFGLVPPPVPTNFELRTEFVGHTKKYIGYEEMYFDYTNSRAKFMTLNGGIEKHFLFDYQVQQIVQYDVIHPGVGIKKDPLSHVCTAVNMEESEHRDIFGYIEDSTGGRPKMFNANQVLRFGGKYSFAFNGTQRMNHRGLLVDKFIGCVYDDYMDATVNASFLFTSKRDLGVGTAGGTLESEVTGIDNGLLSVPVRSDMFGSMVISPEEGAVFFNETFNYFWFKGEPEFKPDTFKIPPYLYCTGYRGRKNMTKFPNAFSTRIQKTTIVRDIFGRLASSEVASFETIFYNKDKNLARRDFTPGDLDTDIKSKFQNTLPVKTIYDFNQGMLYVSNIETGRCYVRPIIHGDFFESSKESLFITMGTPDEVFQMQTDKMEYKGKDFTRDIECDVWAGKYEDKTYNATYVKETYISTNGWHELADDQSEYGVPVKHTIIQNELQGELVEGIISYNFLKFKAKAPALRRFDVSNCIETQNHKDFALLLTINKETQKMLSEYKHLFLETAQYYISSVAQLPTPLRVQRLQFRTVSNSNPRPILLFTLVDKIKLKTRVPFGQPGVTLAEAAENLQRFVDQNQFAIQFYSPCCKSGEAKLVPALKGSLYVKTSTGDLTYFSPVSEVEKSSTENEIIRANDELGDEENEESKGMTSGSLALLGIAMLFIGIGIGVSVMYLYVRNQTDSKVEDRIHLTLKDNKEEVHIEVPSISNIHENAQ